MGELAGIGWGGYVWIALVLATASFAHGAIGFGYPMIATPLLTLVLDLKTAILVILLPSLALIVYNAIAGGRWRDSVLRYWYMPPCLAIGAWLGTKVLIGMDAAPFVLLLALLLMLFLNLERLGKARLPWVKSHPAASGVAFGLVSGFFEATTNVAGATLLIYFMLVGLAPTALVQVLNFSFMFGKGTQLVTWSTSGGVPWSFWASSVPWALAGFVPFWFGSQVRKRASTQAYVRWLRGFMWAMAALLLGQFAWIMWQRL